MIEGSDRVTDILNEALDLEGQERARFLDRACADDDALRREVESLLAEEEAMTRGFLETPAAAWTSGLGSPGSEIPTSIGPYKVEREIGSGGMGRVFLARQDEPIRRLVAIKLLRTSLAGSEAVARFAAERQAMARLGHPSVAHIFDGGTTEDEQPYLVMEYVPGIPITEYCDRKSLPVKKRLRLFLDVCAGVQHAHLNQILHRDLKPSNILVSEVDGRPQVKIIDFGIAKALDGPLGDLTLATGDRVLGTPAYMSPETLQQSKHGPRVDARTDVYSAAIVLYELLTGACPFDPTVGLAEILRQVCEEDPPTLSGKISKLSGERRADIAGERRATAVELFKQLAGDLDWIVQKALAKDADERYASAAELAAEIDRHLRNEPVLTGPRTLRYRFGKFVQRNRTATVTAAFALATLLVGIAGTTYGLIRARHQAEVAREAQAKEGEARQDAEAVTRFLLELFEVADPEGARGSQVTARELLDRGSRRISRELADQPLVRARMMGTLGRIYGHLGIHDQAAALLEDTLELRRGEHGERHLDVAESYVVLGDLYRRQGHLGEAEVMIGRGLALQEELHAPAPVLAETVHTLGLMLSERGEFDRAKEVLGRALDLAETAHGQKSPEAADVLWSLGNCHRYVGRMDEAARLLRDALEIQEKAYDGEHPSIARTLSTLALVHWMSGDLETASTFSGRALAIYEKALGPEHPQVSRVLSNHGYNLFRYGFYEEARPLLERAVRIDGKTTDYDHPFAASRLTNLGLVYWKLGLHAEAEPLFHRATAIRNRLLAPDHHHRATSLWGLANVYRDQGRFDEAEVLYERALKLRENALPDDHPELIDSLREYAVLLRQTGRDGEAAELEARMNVGP